MEKIGTRKTMLTGMLMFIAALALAAFLPTALALFVAFIFVGCYTAVADTVPIASMGKRTEKGSFASSIGFYRAVVGIAALPANLIAGLLWTIRIGDVPATFLFSLAVAIAGAVVFYFLMIRGRR
ncbi:Major Facilitator Superfamily protein [uncultured archaeon]|nr:Major Facilitator Superfamily protein [uncultured archaeon]